jgi:hypothetical protein
LDSNGYTLHVDATSGKLYIRTGDWAQFNKDTILQVPVYAVGDTVSVVNYDTSYTVAGVVATDKNTTYTVTEEDVAKGYVEVVASANSYIGSITLVTTGTPSTTEPTTTNYIKSIASDSVVVDKDANKATLYLFATVAADDLDKIEKVGFIIAPDVYTTVDGIKNDTDVIKTDGTTTVYKEISYNGKTVSAGDGKYIFGVSITDIGLGVTAGYTAYATDKNGETTYFETVGQQAMSTNN